ncbi:hypothetical protein INS49_003931 [Diaporthe citri]|uniref:uncharacterized protein n=1 Tax=Diaporthe citri TaxID=83186 RepID=UPI001C7F5EAE|nr:uncharacterized protein INS49_003931 [Diaporthe citri]KAG6354850.1 hypothetical protein INS49_003931 [Diaporthe citri]
MSSGQDLCAVPVGTAPDGTWDFVHFQSLTTASIAVCVVMTVLALLIAVPRVYVNRRRLLIADYCTILALVFSIAYLVLISLMARFYRHDWNLPACWFDASFAKLQFCLVFFSGLVQFFPRASIFLLYRQLFQVHGSWVHIAIWVGLVGTFLTNAPNIPISIAIEAPHPGETWEDVLVRLSRPSNGHDFRLWGPIQGAASVALDIFAFVLPLPIIAKLNLAPRKRKQLLFLFSTALLGVAASIVALVYKVQLLIKENENQGDETWLLGPVNICIDVESNIAIIVGSMPAFANFMRIHVAESRVFMSLWSKLGGSDPSAPASSNNGNQRRPLHGTIGSPLPRKKVKPTYLELTDTNILKSGYTIEGGEGLATTTTESGQPGILRTTAVTQESHFPRSTDSLVRN